MRKDQSTGTVPAIRFEYEQKGEKKMNQMNQSIYDHSGQREEMIDLLSGELSRLDEHARKIQFCRDSLHEVQKGYSELSQKILERDNCIEKLKSAVLMLEKEIENRTDEAFSISQNFKDIEDQISSADFDYYDLGEKIKNMDTRLMNADLKSKKRLNRVIAFNQFFIFTWILTIVLAGFGLGVFLCS